MWIAGTERERCAPRQFPHCLCHGERIVVRDPETGAVPGNDEGTIEPAPEVVVP